MNVTNITSIKHTAHRGERREREREGIITITAVATATDWQNAAWFSQDALLLSFGIIYHPMMKWQVRARISSWESLDCTSAAARGVLMMPVTAEEYCHTEEYCTSTVLVPGVQVEVCSHSRISSKYHLNSSCGSKFLLSANCNFTIMELKQTVVNKK